MINTANRGIKQPRFPDHDSRDHSKRQKHNTEPSLNPSHVGGKSGAAPALFLIKTYNMLETCDESLAAWTEDGEMFIVKDPDEFAARVIPQYFEHSNFSSFTRQLNFYGFKKIQIVPIRLEPSDRNKPKQVKFHNPHFKKGRKDLLSNIVRSTRNTDTKSKKTDSSAGRGRSNKRDIQALNDKVSFLEGEVAKMEASLAFMEHKMREMSHQVESYRGQNPFAAVRRKSCNYEESIKQQGAATLDPSLDVREIDQTLIPPPPPDTMQLTFFRGLSNESTNSYSELLWVI